MDHRSIIKSKINNFLKDKNLVNPSIKANNNELLEKLRSMDSKMLIQILKKQGYLLPKDIRNEFLNLAITGDLKLIK